MCYFRDKDPSSLKGVIDFGSIKAKLQPIDDKKFIISVKVKGNTIKDFVFKALKSGLIGTWMSYINLNMMNPRIEFFTDSTSKLEQIPELAPRNFWKVSHIANEELLNVAQTGDIVLFTGNQMQANILRGLMGSKYDHVGMLVRYPKSGQLVLFESL